MKKVLSLLLIWCMLIGTTGINNVYAFNEEESNIDISKITSGQALEVIKESEETESSQSEKSGNIDIELSNFSGYGYISYAVEGGNIYFDPETQAIIDFDHTVTKAIIPREIEGVEVKIIGKTKIYDYDLEEIEIPDSVTTIGEYAFAGCRNLKKISIPKSVTSISAHNFSGVFYNCDSLTDITISDDLIAKCNSDIFPSSLSVLNILSVSDSDINFENKFYSLHNLKEVNIDTDNKNYTSIGGVVYNKNKTELIYCPTKIESLEIPESVVNINFNKLYEQDIKEIVIDTNNKNYTVMTGLVYNKDKTELIYCPKGIEKAEIPNGISIKEKAFYNCKNLKSIKVSQDLVTEGKTLEMIIEDEAFKNCYNLELLEIPNGITEINGYVDIFDGCGSLKTIKIPESVTKIRLSLFDNCGTLTDFVVDEENSNYSSYKGILYNKDKTKLLRCGIGVKNVEIIDSVTDIESNAFNYCYNLKNIVIPKAIPHNGHRRKNMIK